jgi:hypothetical protein
MEAVVYGLSVLPDDGPVQIGMVSGEEQMGGGPEEEKVLELGRTGTERDIKRNQLEESDLQDYESAPVGRISGPNAIPPGSGTCIGDLLRG